MNENTQSNKKSQNNQDSSNPKINSINTPIELNKYYEKINKYDENNNLKYKTITQSRKNNNTNESIQKPQNLFTNTYDGLNKTTTDSHTDKKDKNEYYRNKSLPKNTKNVALDNKHENIFAKSSNNEPKMKKMIRDNINQSSGKDININLAKNDKNKSDEDSENLSKLAEDLLSISDEYNIQLMRKNPINKNDFIGESKVFYNINDMNKIEGMPKLQTQLYVSPLTKLNIKNIAYANKIINMKNANMIKKYNNNNIINNEYINNSNYNMNIVNNNMNIANNNNMNITNNNLNNNYNNNNKILNKDI